MSVLNTLKFITTHPLTQDRKWSAIARFVKWQIGSRFLWSSGKIIPFVEQACLFVKPGMTGATGNIYVGLHEFSDMAFVLHFLKESDCFLDVGANIGSYTIIASVIAKAYTIAVEPVPKTFQALMVNIDVNKIKDRVKALNVGVGSKKESVCFTTENDTTNHVVSCDCSNLDNIIELPVLPLDEILNEHIPILIKIDVEGFELEVLKGAKSTLANNKLAAVIIELNGSGSRYGVNDDAIHSELVSFGFEAYRYDPILRTLEYLDGNYGASGNTLYIRSLDFVLERLVSAPTFKVLDKNI